MILQAIGILLIIIYLLPNDNKRKLNKKGKSNYAILIPARNEEKVIKGLMESLKKQSVKVDFNDVYVMVSDKNDLAIPILKKYNCNILTRINPSLERKGYTLDELIKSIKKEYDLYFIFDADNILDKDFIKNMLEEHKKGYDIVTSKRLNKNPSDSVTSYCSGLLFILLNIFNKSKSNNNENVILSGTGFFISGEIIKKLGGYPFYTLTEDYELTLYSIINEYNSGYCDKATFYDEQPIKIDVSIKQRTRWIKGYFENRNKYNKELIENYKKTRKFSILKEIIGIKGIIVVLLWAFISILLNFSLAKIVYILSILYLTLFLVTLFLILCDDSKVNNELKFKSLFFNPIFLLSYIVCLFKSFGNVSWDVIKHEKDDLS